MFVNPAAGRGGAGRSLAGVRPRFADRNYPVEDSGDDFGEEFRKSVRAAVTKAFSLIAMGGDGRCRLLAREALGRAARIGVIPAGGGNDSL